MALVMKSVPLTAFLLFFLSSFTHGYVQVRSDGLYYKDQKVYLSGVNFAWNSYGFDFGDNNYFSGSQGVYERWLQEVSSAGGNAVRFWLHIEGYLTPAWDGEGFVTGGDTQGTIGDELLAFLDKAAEYNVFIIPVLWNGAYLTKQEAINLVWDDNKLQSYLDKALIPLVQAVSGHPALAAWEIANEPEGSIRAGDSNGNPCFDTTNLSGSGAGWTGVNIPMERYLRFTNWQISAIKSVDPDAVVTQGAWNERSQTNTCSGCRNYWSDECLIAAGGKTDGTLGFYQMHAYAWEGQYGGGSPFSKSAGDFGLDKPLVIGEYSVRCGDGRSSGQLAEHGYYNGYAGTWIWQWNESDDCCDSTQIQGDGLRHLHEIENPGSGLISVDIRENHNLHAGENR